MSPTAYGGASLSSWAKGTRPRLPDNMGPCSHGRIPPPTVCSPCPFGRHLSTLGHYAWRVLPPSPCPPGAPSPRSVLSHWRLLPALECVSLEGCLFPRGFAPSPLERILPLRLRTGGFIPSPRPDFYYSHLWPVRLTRHYAWRRMERGGVGVGDGFPFTFWLAHFKVLALSSPFSLNALQLPSPFSCGWIRYPSCFTSSTLLLHYLWEWTEVIGTSLVCARRR